MLDMFINKEELTKDAVQAALEKVAEELNTENKENFHEEFFITIKPIDKEFNFRCFVMQKVNNAPKLIREITVKEIVG